MSIRIQLEIQSGHMHRGCSTASFWQGLGKLQRFWKDTHQFGHHGSQVMAMAEIGCLSCVTARLASLQNLNLKISPSGGTHILVHSMINELVEYLTNTYHFSSMPSHLMESVSTWRSEDKLSQTTATLMNMPSALTGMLQTAYHS